MMQVKKVKVTDKREVNRLDVDGKWPKGTWLQRRLALMKLITARAELDEGIMNGNE